MKTYKHLYEVYCDRGTFSDGYDFSFQDGKLKRKKFSKVYFDPGFKDKAYDYALNFKRVYHTPKLIYDGLGKKQRNIIVPTVLEQIVHNMVYITMKPIFHTGLYEHSYGSIPDRGCYLGMKTIKKWIKKDSENCKYCLKMDIRKFFESIPHDILIKKLRKIIKDEKFMYVLIEVIESAENGLPLGFYTSQWLANWYLQDFDHFVKEQLRAKYYIRYMDDMVIFDVSKETLHYFRKEIQKYLNERLGLTLKDNWQVFLFHYVKEDGSDGGRPLDFMGYKFYRNRITMRKRIMYRATQKARRMGKKEKPTIYDCQQMTAYLGWIDGTDTYQMYLDKVKPYVNIQDIKRRIANYNRRRSKEDNENNMEQSRKHRKAKRR